MSQSIDIAGGSHAPAEVRRMLTALCRALHELHAQGQVHGGITLGAVTFDGQGRATLAPVTTTRHAGYAPFESYAADPAWPIGTSTDTYAVGAIGLTLMSGRVPPDALTRQRDPARALIDSETLREYPPQLVSAIQHAMEMLPAQRTQSAMQFLEEAGWAHDAPIQALGISPDAMPALAPKRMASVATPDAAPESATRDTNRMPVWRMGAVGLLFVIAGVLWWLNRDPIQMPPMSFQPSDESKAAGAWAPPVTAPQANLPQPETPQSEAPQPPAPQPPASEPLASAAAELGGAAEPGANEPSPTANTAIATPSNPSALPVEPPETTVPVMVQVNVRPWGEVFINGVSRGVSPPMQRLQLAPGTYRVSIRNSGAAAYNTRLTVVSGKRARINHDFE